MPSSVFQTYFSAPSRQKVKLWTVWCVAVLGKISTAMWGHRLEILTTQWCVTGSSQLRLLSGWSISIALHEYILPEPSMPKGQRPLHVFISYFLWYSGRSSTPRRISLISFTISCPIRVPTGFASEPSAVLKSSRIFRSRAAAPSAMTNLSS